MMFGNWKEYLMFYAGLWTLSYCFGFFAGGVLPNDSTSPHMSYRHNYSYVEYPEYGGRIFRGMSGVDSTVYFELNVDSAAYIDLSAIAPNESDSFTWQVVDSRAVEIISYYSCVDKALDLIAASKRRGVKGRYMIADWPNHVQAVRLMDDGEVQFLQESALGYAVYAGSPEEEGEYRLLNVDVFRRVRDSMIENEAGLRTIRLDDVLELMRADQHVAQ